MDLDSMSREKLLERAQLLQKAKTIQAQKTSATPEGAGLGLATGGGSPAAPPVPEGSAENPLQADLFKSNANRTKAGFGDPAGVTPLIEGAGYTGVKKNASGRIVAQGADGKYYRDEDGLRHPVNFAESHVGPLLPTAGMVLGGLAGDIPGAGVGGAAGEAARIALGKEMGTYRGGAGQAAKDVALEGAGGLANEAGGKYVAKIPVPGTEMSVGEATKAGLEKLLQGGKIAASKASSVLTGRDSAAFYRLWQRPDQVMEAQAPGNALRVMRAGQDELAARAAHEGSAISKARVQFNQKYGRDPINTAEMVQGLQDALDRNAPNEAGHSGMTEAERQELQGYIDYLKSSGGPPGAPPAKPAGSLQRTADMLQEKISPQDRLSAPTRSSKAVGAYERLVGQIKDAFHKKSSDLSDADARFHDYAGKVKLVGPLENDATGEGFVDNMFGRNKGARQEAAQALVPKAYEDMADLGASKHLDFDGRLTKIGGPTAPAMFRLGSAGMGAAMGGMATQGTPEGMLGGFLIGTGAATMTAPVVHKYATYLAAKYGAKGLEKMIASPQLIPFILSASDQKLLGLAGRNPWSEPNGQEDRR